MKKYGVLLFDADETLLDFKAAERSAASELFYGCGAVVTDGMLARYSEFNDSLWKKLERGIITREYLTKSRFVEFFAREGIEADGEAAAARYYSLLGAQSQLTDGAIEILEYFHGKIPMYIVTNGLGRVQRPRLAGAGITELVDGIFISEEIGANKPSAEFFDAVFAAVGVSASDALLIGDSLSADISGGVGYGIDTCWFCPRGEKPTEGLVPTYVIRDLGELKKICG